MAIPPRRHPIRTFLKTYPHVWYLLIWIVYLMLFWLAEHLIVDKYWVSHLPIDDQIPFCRFFIIPYCTWHPLLFLMTAYLFFTDAPAFKRFVVYIGLGFGGSILFCMLFPNGQDLRPTEFAQNDFFIWLVRMVYAADTNTNVCPSIHVIGSFAVYFAVRDIRRFRAKGWRLGFLTMAVLISLSTVFLKQHSVLDVLAGLAVCAAAYPLIYRVPAGAASLIPAGGLGRKRFPEL